MEKVILRACPIVFRGQFELAPKSATNSLQLEVRFFDGKRLLILQRQHLPKTHSSVSLYVIVQSSEIMLRTICTVQLAE